jgi:hypothetical protein
MNAGVTVSAIARMIDFLRACALAPPHEFPSYARSCDQQPRIPTGEAGDCATMLQLPAMAIVRQLQHATPETQKLLRDALTVLAAALSSEAEAHGGIPQPFYLER